MIRPATTADFRYIDSLQWKFAPQISFLPRPAIQWYLDRGHISLATVNDDPVGYVLSHRRLRWCPAIRPIFQAAVQLDARRLSHGRIMVNMVISAALEAGQRAVQANCVESPEQDAFWLACGFLDMGYLPTTNSRRRRLRCWRRFLHGGIPADLIMMPRRHGMMSRR